MSGAHQQDAHEEAYAGEIHALAQALPEGQALRLRGPVKRWRATLNDAALCMRCLERLPAVLELVLHSRWNCRAFPTNQTTNHVDDSTYLWMRAHKCLHSLDSTVCSLLQAGQLRAARRAPL